MKEEDTKLASGSTINDALFPLREAFRKNEQVVLKTHKEKESLKSLKINVKADSRTVIDGNFCRRKTKLDLAREKMSNIHVEKQTPQANCQPSNTYFTKLKSGSETPEWFSHARRSTTVRSDRPSDDLGAHLSDFAEKQAAFEDGLFPRTPDTFYQVVMKTPEAMTPEVLARNWGSLSVTERTRGLSNWKNLSAARTRHLSTASIIRGRHLSTASARRSVSALSMHREASLSVSIALASFHYALRRSTCYSTAPEVCEGFFAEQLELFAIEQERVQEETTEAILQLAPIVQSVKLSI